MNNLDRYLLALKGSIHDYAKQVADESLARRLRELGHEAHLEGKDLHVGPLYHCEDRPNIDGHYSKFKFDYMFLYPNSEVRVAGWVTFNTSEIDPTLPLTLQVKENDGHSG